MMPAKLTPRAQTAQVLFLALLALLGAPCGAEKSTVLVTGATGRTGSILYRLVAQDPQYNVRALVRNASKAASVLGCNPCDPAHGIFEGDVTDPSSLVSAFAGVDVLADVVGGGGTSQAGEEAVEFTGVINQVKALVSGGPSKSAQKYVVMCSSMGTTDPKPAPYEGGTHLFWKLNAEAFLMSSGVPAAIVKPGGLMDSPCCNSTLVTGHNDDLLKGKVPPIVSRADVARVMKAALDGRMTNLRFGLIGESGTPTKDADLPQLLSKSRWPWAQ